ncbi:MAG: hypothetical protein ACKOYJ_12575 [Planctomycetia bacterium]
MNAYPDADEADDDWDDDKADLRDDSDDEPIVPCPFCKQEILEDSPRCPYCERYISEEDHVGPKKPIWVIATALACLGIALWWIFAAF